MRRAEYNRTHKEQIAFQTKAYRLSHKEEIAKTVKRNRKTPSFKATRNLYLKLRYENDIQHRLRVILRNRLNDAVKEKFKGGSAVRNLGCSINELIFYLEGKFKDGMSWENHGKWHIDHVVPLAFFDLSNPVHVARAAHYTNLQPLWAKENLVKNKYIISTQTSV